ncbi:MAG: PAS domain S-box protein [Bryobacteraceae bacterium]
MTADSVLELISRALEQIDSGVSVSDIESQLSAVENAPDGARSAIAAVLECARALADVRHQAHLHSALAESASDVITIVGPDGVIRYQSPSVRRVLGYDPDELINVNGFALMHPDEIPDAKEKFAKALAKPGVHPAVERRIRHKNGSWRVLELVSSTRTDNPHLSGLIVSARDVTERYIADHALVSSEERYRGIFENANDIIYTHDLNGNFTSLNPAGEFVSGYTRSEAMKLNLRDVVVKEHQQLALEMIARKIGGDPTTTYELEIISKTGNHISLEVSTRLIFDRGRPVAVLGIARDVTERKHLEAQLRQAQKMEAIGRLAGGVAHDFNNMLTVITGYTQWMVEDMKPDDPLRESAAEVLLAANRAAALTNQLLAFSRHHILQPVPSDLNALVANIDRMLRRVIGEDVELVTNMSVNLGKVRVDQSQMEQVLLNLVVNARDAMPSGGRIVIETSNVHLDEAYARTHLNCSPGQYVMLAVSDTGAGMDEITRSRIFEPFFTTKGGKGTGLGLSTVYGIVKQSGGLIWVYSEVGVGTVFKIYFPKLRDEADLALATADMAVAVKGGVETILLVEDEAGVRRMIREMLRRQGYTILEASDGHIAQKICREYDRPIALLLTDVVMPEISGRELSERLHQDRPSMRVLFMSGYTDDAIVLQGALEAGIAFLQKPFTPDQLALKVRQVLDN